ncbi:MAG: hypothetical protein OIF55_18975 [Amphritea sp.]|nr:hypothetical protein [Amphritea sp.]
MELHLSGELVNFQLHFKLVANTAQAFAENVEHLLIRDGKPQVDQGWLTGNKNKHHQPESPVTKLRGINNE